MRRLIAAEALKLRTTRTAVALIGAAVGIVVVLTILLTLLVKFDSRDFTVIDLLGFTGFAQPFALILGILAVSTEFRHGTITPTLIAAPSRTHVVLAKLAANVLAGLLLGAVTVGLAVAIALLGLSARGIETGLSSGDVIRITLGQIVACGLWAAIGVGFGTLVRNQVGAVVGALIWIFLAENFATLIPTVGDWVQKYGLNGVSNGLGDLQSDSTGDVLGQVPAGLLMAAYAALFVIAGVISLRTRDVTS
jgi:ABC-2 type transport system permease protein